MNESEIISDLQYVKGVGPKRAEALAKAGILTLTDLIFNFPVSYIDRNSEVSLKSLSSYYDNESQLDFLTQNEGVKISGEAGLIAKIVRKELKEFRGRKKCLKLYIKDSSEGTGTIIFWNGINYFNKLFNSGQTIAVVGKPDPNKYNSVSFTHPDVEIIDPEETANFESGKILPKYSMPEGFAKASISQKLLRQLIDRIIDQKLPEFQETLPQYLINKYNLPGIKDSIKQIHFPGNASEINKAKTRFKFEEIFNFQLFLAHRKDGQQAAEKGIIFDPASKLARELYDNLPFNLTSDQKKVLREFANDVSSGKPMNRLLQGDVGSGKTIVTILMMLIAVDNGCQAAIMAPTEILAEQHYHTIQKLLKNFEINIATLTGSLIKRARAHNLESISSGKAEIIIGTHSLFESDIIYKNLGLIIIDEQHRFGVAQRAKLKLLAERSVESKGAVPHMLVMSATPIPRTLSMTLYGDLDVSLIKEKPANRKDIKTSIVYQNELPQVYDFIRKEVLDGRQCYIVYPLVEESEKLDLKAATVHYEYLKENIFPDLKCGLLHGQMKWNEKEETMTSFLNNEYDILVATTVIEVGIDVPNATIMLIENAERFGLSQLHQLRGRVGRSNLKSYCMLSADDKFRWLISTKNQKLPASVRLNTMVDTNDGFEIAEADLNLRGPGDLLGTRQAGLPEFRFVDLVRDGDIITKAKKEAFRIISEDSGLNKPENILFRKTIERIQRNSGKYFDIA